LANAVLFAPTGLHEYLKTLLAAYTGVKYVVLGGDDRIIPMARLADGTALLPEPSYTAGSGDLTPAGSTEGEALSADTCLSHGPLGVLDSVDVAGLSGSLWLPDLAVGRLVETPAEITTAIATFISQEGVLDISAGGMTHKVLVTGYDFLTDAGVAVRSQWK